MSQLANPKKLLSIIMPVYNEEANVELAYHAVCATLDTVSDRYEFELVFTDNHSVDRTFELLTSLARQDSRVKVLRFNRNYGFQRSMLTGYRMARGHAAIQLDCDLQDPPAIMLEFLRLWEEGHDVVVGIREKRQEHALLAGGRRLFYRIMSRIAEDPLPRDAGDFRLLDRSVLKKLVRLNDINPYLRGMSSSFATNPAGVSFTRAKRLAGESKFPLHRLIRMASDSVFSLTLFPLRLAGHVSFLSSLVTLGLAAFYFISALFFGANWPSGFATLVLLLLFSISLNGAFMAIIGRYVGQIYLQQQNRPYIVVESFHNFEEAAVDRVERPRY